MVPVIQWETWELHRLWLGDMPNTLRQDVGFMRLRSLDPTIAFNASMEDLIAATPEPIQDVGAAMLARQDGRYQVQVEAVNTDVPAILDLPENPGTRPMPYILITLCG